MWEDKIWGQVWHIFNSDQSAVSHLQVEKGHCCSRHKHLERANMFAVISGVIEIEQWNGDLGTMMVRKLVPGDTCIVPSGIIHRFRVIESGQVIEIYWPDVSGGKVQEDDIVRLDEGR